MIHPGDSAVLTPNPTTLAFDSGPNALDSDDVFGGNPPHLINSGGALQLVAPDGSIVDAFAYGSWEDEIEGWNGPALEWLPTDSAGLILMRGDGCGTLPDTNTSADWEDRWLRLRSSLFCDDGIFASSGTLTTAALIPGCRFAAMLIPIPE